MSYECLLLIFRCICQGPHHGYLYIYIYHLAVLLWLPTSRAWTSSIGHRFERTCAKASLSIVEQRFNSGSLDVHFNTEWYGGMFKGVNGRGIILATSSLTKKHLQMIESQFWQLFENNTWDVFQKTSVAHTNRNKLWSCRGLSTWFALESSSSTQVPWPVDQLTKAIVGIKLTSGSRSFQHLPCWFWNLEFLSSIWGLHGFTSWVWWMERIARKHGCQDASFYQTTSQLIIFINTSTFVFLTKSSFETQIPKKSIPSSRCCFSWTKL